MLAAEAKRLLASRAARYARREIDRADDRAEALFFRRGENRFAWPVISLREVRQLRRVCSIPGGTPAIPGLVHCRGELISLHDLAGFLDPSSRRDDAPGWVIFTEHRGLRFGLVADLVDEAAPIRRAGMAPLPVSFGDRSVLFEGILGDGSILVRPASLAETVGFLHPAK